MPSKALSLVGFVGDRAVALRYLRTRCIAQPPNLDDDALEAIWRAAQAGLGPPIDRAGHPEMRQIPSSDPHIAALLAVDWAGRFRPFLDKGATFQMVEIDPLIAAQLSIDCDKSAAQCAGLSVPPTDAELMRVSLPLNLPSGAVQVSREPHSMIVKSDSLNLIIGAQGPMPEFPQVVGIHLGWTLPLVNVARYNGRCILQNGYNRAVGARLAGATEIPCLFRDVSDAAEAGLHESAPAITEEMVMSDNPPTLAHFTQGRAAEVRLRRSMRVIQVSWAQHTLYDE